MPFSTFAHALNCIPDMNTGNYLLYSPQNLIHKKCNSRTRNSFYLRKYFMKPGTGSLVL